MAADVFEPADDVRLGAFVDRLVDRPPVTGVGGKIPWHEPAFSARMLREHLDQSHDRASRAMPTIDGHVRWIFDELLDGRPGSVLDLGCGPGLYSERLARLGCRCRGVDISPASIRHAGAVATADGLDCEYVLGDVLTADLGRDHDLAMMLFGEFNTFPRAEARHLLERIAVSLRPGGILLVEAHTFDSVVAEGVTAPGWFTASQGLFSEQPHLVLSEHDWDPGHRVATSRIHVAADTGRVDQYTEALHAYRDDEYLQEADVAGYDDVAIGVPGAFADPAMVVITARAAARTA